MKLLLVNPYFGVGEKLNTEGATHSQPLGLGFLATYIRDYSNWEVEIVDPVPQKLTEAEVLEKVKKSDIVGLSCFADTRFFCFDFAKKVKKKNPKTKLIIGGPFTYALHEKIIKNYPFIDIVVRGEGEETLLEIVKEKNLTEIHGITYAKGKKIIVNPERKLERNIDKYDLDYSLFPPLEMYGKDWEASKELRELRTLNAIASRGCPFGCTYCSNIHWQRSWRSISPEELVRRMKKWKNDLKVEYVHFYDDLFTANKAWVLKVCKLLKKERLNLSFRVLVRAGTDKEILKQLKSAGCKAVGFGVESGSDVMLRRINKQITKEQILKTATFSKELGFWIIGSFIISLPEETEEDYQKSLSLIPIMDTFAINILIIYPYTQIYNDLVIKKEINDDIWFNRKYEGRILFTKENFKTARHTLSDLRWKRLYPYYYHFLHRPDKAFEKYGYLFGIIIIIISMIDIPLRGKLFDLIYLFKGVYRKIIY